MKLAQSYGVRRHKSRGKLGRIFGSAEKYVEKCRFAILWKSLVGTCRIETDDSYHAMEAETSRSSRYKQLIAGGLGKIRRTRRYFRPKVLTRKQSRLRLQGGGSSLGLQRIEWSVFLIPDRAAVNIAPL